MRIGITVDALSPRLTGIGRYTWELCEGLRAQSNDMDLAFFRFDDWVDRPGDYLKPMKKRRFRLPKYYRRWRSTHGFRNRLIHGTNYLLPNKAEAGVVTVHDLSIFLHADTHPLERVQSFERHFQSSLRRAEHVITDSETVRQEFIDYFSWRADKVTAVPLGVSPDYRQRAYSDIAPDIARLLGPDVGEYILSVATFEPRKRIEAAIRAHALFCDRTGEAIPLVLVGAEGWRNEALHELIDEERAKGRLITLGYVAESQLPILYAGARLFLYPSIYEGFGLPPIEAMRCGIPTIVANRSCLPEVTGGAAILTDPDDLDGFSAVIEQALFDTEFRAAKIAAGLLVAESYCWTRCVEKTAAVYAKVMGTVSA